MKKRYLVLIGIVIVVLFICPFMMPRFFENNKQYTYMVYDTDGYSTYSQGVLCVTRECGSCHKDISIFDRNFHPEKLSYKGKSYARVYGTYTCKNPACKGDKKERHWGVYIYRDIPLPVGKEYEYEFVCVENVLHYDYIQEKQLLVVRSRCKFCDRIVTHSLQELEITDKPFSDNKHVLRKSFNCYCNYGQSQVWQIDVLRTIV